MDHAPKIDPDRLPRIGDPAAAERGLARWTQQQPAPAPDDASARRLLEVVFGNSPYLSDLLLAEPQIYGDVLTAGPDAVFAKLLTELEDFVPRKRAEVMAQLRASKRRVALLAALADLAELWQVEEVTRALTRFADRAVQCALESALFEAAQRGDLDLELDLDGATRLQERSGLFVIGMGKLGAFELNYSSDIDVIVLFDPERFRTRGREAPMALAVRLTRALVYLLEHRNRDGYVFRTDLRLRPHPPGHPLALAAEDAEQYYERHGQNWERAALIKARVIAGDLEVGEKFLAALRPFIWRKHLDYAAIKDIHSIKRQINARRGHGTIRVAGHDLKVGRGGIREIEFFVQTQQLILGGRVPELRESGTCAALRTLAAQRWVEPQTVDELIGAYRFLRRLEHRLQMVADKQTHSLPERPDQLERFAPFMGFVDADALAEAVRRQLETVETHYAALFESSIDLGGGRALVFTGTDDDPATLATLTEMGFESAAAIAARIRAWHHGHIRATRTARARELLTELMPSLLDALAKQLDPDATFARFDEFISGLPAGVQLFSLIRANPSLLALLADLMGIAPRLADHLSHHVNLFEAMLAPDFMEPVPVVATLAAELDRELARVTEPQDVLDVTRRWTQGREFQIGLHILLGFTDGDAASEHLTGIAETVLTRLLPRVQTWLESQHGAVAGGAFVVLGLGKLGSRELTIGSDLDLIFVFDAAENARSSGERSLSASTYFARLGQRLVSALTAQTAEGGLYEIDTRLRPSGNLGPVACSLANFERYQMQTAETWEHQALTRARVVAGDIALGEKVEAAVRRALRQPRPDPELAREIAAMRARIFREHGDQDPWNLKHVRGGLVEAEFLAQYLQLRFAPEHPMLLTSNTVDTFERAAAVGVLPLGDSVLLIRAIKLYRRLQAVLRLSVGERFDAAAAPQGLRRALLRAAAVDHEFDRPGLDFAVLERDLKAMQAAVGTIFEQLCPAAEQKDQETPP